MLSEIKHTRKITNDGSYKNVSFRYLKTSINEHTVDFTYEPDFEFECDIINNHENKTWIRNDDSKFAEFYSSLLNRITEILQKENKRFKREFFMDKTRFSFKINDSKNQVNWNSGSSINNIVRLFIYSSILSLSANETT